EALAFGGVLALALGLMATRQDLGEALPLLGIYAFAAYRLLPAAQRIYTSMSLLRFGMPAVDAIYDDLVNTAATASSSRTAGEQMHIADSIRFDSVDFEYPGAGRPALIDINLTIKARTTVGLVGRTG